MAGIVQHKSGVFAPRGFGFVTFDNPVTEGNLIVAVVAGLPAAGDINVQDTQGNGTVINGSEHLYATAIDTGFSGPSTIELCVFYAIAGASGTLGVDANIADSEQAYHLHIYEVEGYTRLDQVGQNFQASTENATVSTAGPTIAADEFVIAVFGNKSGTVTWTLGGALSGEESTNEVDTVATGGEVVSAKGVQTATASTDSADDLTSVIVTFSNLPASGPGPFLGSVVVSESDSDAAFPFIGSVTIIAAPPDGNPTGYPFLGRVKVGAAPAGASGKIIGGTVVVVSAPDDNPDAFPYLGTVESL